MHKRKQSILQSEDKKAELVTVFRKGRGDYRVFQCLSIHIVNKFFLCSDRISYISTRQGTKSW